MRLYTSTRPVTILILPCRFCYKVVVILSSFFADNTVEVIKK